jgi:hypothetical protein
MLNYCINQKNGFVHRTEDKVEGGFIVMPNTTRRVRTQYRHTLQTDFMGD